MRKLSAAAKPDSIRIRRARPGDERELDGLYAQLHGKDYASPGTAKMRRAIRAVARQRDQTLLVAVKDGRIVGTSHVLIFRHLARGLRPAAIVENVVVDANCRGAKIGEQLMAEAVAIARRHNCYKVALTSNRKRRDAHRFYQRLDWRWTHFGYTLALPE
ncbi:MAG: GNAT family N-acetyltransferase [Candidatus Binatales bacterium]